MRPAPYANRAFWNNLTPLRAVRLVIVVATILAVIAAALERLVDPAFETFGSAAWWAVSTVSTVGYGDVLPESSLGRWIAAGLMLLGMSLVPILTSVVVSVLISNRSKALEANVGAERAELLELARRIEKRLERLEHLERLRETPE
jgi:voltage-gated potassium channel